MPLVGRPSPSQVEDIWRCSVHRSYIFPGDITKTVTFTAGDGAGDYGSWAEVADNLGATLSDLTTSPLHVSGMKIRSETVDDKLYQIVLGYGASSDDVTTWDVHEFGSGTKKIEGDEQVRFRPPIIPAGSKIYYRMKCETGEAACTVSFRYHYH